MFKPFVSTLGWINKRGEEAVLPQRRGDVRPPTSVLHPHRSTRSIPKTVMVTMRKFGNNSGATAGKPVGIVNVTERTKSIRHVHVAVVFFGCFFSLSLIVLLSELLKKCLFFYFFLVYFSLFEERALSVVWDRRYLWSCYC